MSGYLYPPSPLTTLLLSRSDNVDRWHNRCCQFLMYFPHYSRSNMNVGPFIRRDVFVAVTVFVNVQRHDTENWRMPWHSVAVVALGWQCTVSFLIRTHPAAVWIVFTSCRTQFNAKAGWLADRCRPPTLPPSLASDFQLCLISRSCHRCCSELQAVYNMSTMVGVLCIIVAQ